MNGMSTPAATPHPLLEQLVSHHGFTALDADSLDDFAAAPGHALLVFTEDPVRYRETLDLVVIAPEIARALAGRFRTGVLFPSDARKVAPRFGFARWPALGVLRDGAYVGAIDGLRTWDEYLEETRRLLSAETTRAPSVGIAVKPAGLSGCGH
jgi:hydrogenase-1 operon protein HyaE